MKTTKDYTRIAGFLVLIFLIPCFWLFPKKKEGTNQQVQRENPHFGVGYFFARYGDYTFIFTKDFAGDYFSHCPQYPQLQRGDEIALYEDEEGCQIYVLLPVAHDFSQK